jgi:Holliday junction DNA helicase RuvA
MIGRIAGIIDYKTMDHVLIDVRGVGYIIYCSDRTLATLPAAGAPAVLYTDMVVREDSQTLYGFPDSVEKEWHRLLTTVQGVGAKASLAILGALGTDGVSRAIALGDWGAVKAAKGVGPKLAQRIVSELKDKAPSIMAMTPVRSGGADLPQGDDVLEPSAPVTPRSTPRPAPRPAASTAQADALSALTNLGYAPSEAAGAVAASMQEDPDASSSAVIKAALKRLAPKD